MINYYGDITARLYQSGKDLEDAVQQGADRKKFEALENEFNGGSIPVHLLHGFDYKAAYSCEYHTGGAAGALLRKICKWLKNDG